MDILYDNLFDDYAEDEDIVIQPRRYRTRFDFDTLTDREIIDSFRLRRSTILMLNDRIRQELTSSYPNRATDLTSIQKLLIALR